MKDRTLFGLVDRIPGKHPLDGLFQLALTSESKKEAKRLLGHNILGVVHEDIFKRDRKPGEPFRVLIERDPPCDGFSSPCSALSVFSKTWFLSD